MAEAAPRQLQETLEGPGLRGVILTMGATAGALTATVRTPGRSLAQVLENVLTTYPTATVTRGPDNDTYEVVVHTHEHRSARKAVSVRVPTQCAAHVLATRASTGASATQQVLDAYAEHHDALREAATERRRRLGLPPGGPQRRRGGAPTTQLWINPTPEELALLDHAAASWCAGNRSALCTLLLTAATTNQPLTHR